ncbi:MAG TPA: hypothetical protein VKA06_04350, partial [Spirochaetia bacterium]|nr:hypothetical protein [Spirochaetia bacterium]
QSRRCISGATHALALCTVLIEAPCLFAGGSHEVDVSRVETFGAKLVRLARPGMVADSWPIIYREDGQESVLVVNVRYDPESDRSADLYYPPGVEPTADKPRARGAESTRLPVLLFPMGLSAGRFAASEDSTPRDSATYLGFASLYANRGVVSVVYDADDILAGIEAILDFLLDHEDELLLDSTRIGIWATSGNGRLASRVVARPDLVESVRACVFIHADANLTVVPPHAAYFIAYSRDGSNIERYSATLARRVVARGLESEQIDDVSYKNFFLSDGTTEARAVIERSARFVEKHLVDPSPRKTQEDP